MTAPKNIDEALFELQKNPPILRKDKDGQVGNQKTKYADLIQANEVILPRLCELGLLWVTAPTIRVLPDTGEKDGPRFVLDWEMKHVPSGTSRAGAFPLPPNANPMQNGSAITYARRYSLIAITNAVAEDDDDDGGGYRGRQGMAQRANVRQEQSRPAAQRAQPPTPRGERARPPQQPDLPPATGGPQGPPAGSEQTAPEPHRGRGGLITEPMVRKLAILVRECGITGDARLPWLIDTIDRKVSSSKDLTFDEGRHLIDALEKAKTADTPEVKAVEIYLRTTAGVDAPEPAAAPPAKPAGRNRSIVGDPAGAGADEAPPWENEQQALMDAPRQSAQRRGEGE